MATVIDSLIITLGLDAKAFSKGQKQTSADLQQTRKETESVAKDIARQGQVASEFFVKLRNNALGLFAIFTAGRGIKDFIRDITQGDAQLGYFSRNINMTSQQLQAWQFAARQSGGSAEEMTAALTAMSNAQQDYALTGQSSVIPYLNALHVSWADNGKARDGSKIFLDLADRFSKMDPARAQAFGRGLNLPPGVVQTLMKGRVEIERLARLQKELGGIQPGDDKRAQQLNNALERLRTRLEGVFRDVLRILGPQLLTLMGRIEKWTLSPEFARTLEKIRTNLANIPWEKIWTDISTFGSNVDSVVQKLGGWVEVTEALFILWGVNKVTGLIRNIVAVGASILNIVAPKIPGMAPAVPGAVPGAAPAAVPAAVPAASSGFNLATVLSGIGLSYEFGRILSNDADRSATQNPSGFDARMQRSRERLFGPALPYDPAAIGNKLGPIENWPSNIWNWSKEQISNASRVSHNIPTTINQLQDRGGFSTLPGQEIIDWFKKPIGEQLGGLGNWANEQLRRGDEHMSRLRQQPNETFTSMLMGTLGLDKPLERAGKWVNQTVNTGAQSMAQTGGQFNQSIMDWIKRQFTFQHYTSPVQQQEERMAAIRRFLDETEHKQGNTGLGMRDDAKERVMREFLERHHTEYGMYQPSAYTPSQSTANGLGGPRTAPVNMRITPDHTPLPTGGTGQIASFIQKYGPYAKMQAEATGTSAEFWLGKWAQETGWGRSAHGNNLGNIKPGSNWHGRTQVLADGLTYRAYDNVEEYLRDERDLTSRMYPGAINAGNDTRRAAHGLESGVGGRRYAEDPNYAAHIEARIEQMRRRNPLGIDSKLFDNTPRPTPSSLYVNPNAGTNNNVNSEMNIHNIHINTQATDAPGIARSIGENLQKHSAVMQFDYGLA